jgi:hypothetical protein
MNVDPSIIDNRITEARSRDNAVCEKLKNECARLVAIDQFSSGRRALSLDNMTMTLRPARYSESTNSNPNIPTYPTPENGSYALQLFSAIMFAVDARAELKMLELIRSPDFYAAIITSAAEVRSNERS